jgi:hypothetical protein
MNRFPLFAAAAWLAACCLPLLGLSTLVRAAETGAVALTSAAQPCPHCTGCPHCAGCSHDEIVYQDVVCHRCVMVPDKKQIKKTVYDCKEVPFCLPKLPPFFSHLKKKDCCDDCCEECVECDCPRYKKVLLKKEVVCEEICITKCVIEEYVQRMPVRVCRQCPHCSQASLPQPMTRTIPAAPPVPLVSPPTVPGDEL